MELRRIELLSENKSTQASPSAGYALHSLCRYSITKVTTSVVSYTWKEPKHSPTHVHHSNDASAYAVVIIGETTPQLGSVS